MNGKLTVIGKSGHSAFYGSYINPCTTLARTVSKLKSIKLDSGTKYMPSSHLEITKMNVDNLSENVVPQSASAKAERPTRAGSAAPTRLDADR